MARAGLSATTVVRAAAELADEAGTAEVGLSDLARRLGVRTPSLYSHVAGADDLRVRVALLALEEMAAAASAAVAGRAGRDALVALADAYRGYAAAHPGRYAASRLPLDEEQARASAGPRHAELTRAVLRDYDLAGADQTHAVRLLGSTFHGFIELEASGAFAHSEPGAGASWERILDALDLLLRTWSTTPPD